MYRDLEVVEQRHHLKKATELDRCSMLPTRRYPNMRTLLRCEVPKFWPRCLGSQNEIEKMMDCDTWDGMNE